VERLSATQNTSLQLPDGADAPIKLEAPKLWKGFHSVEGMSKRTPTYATISRKSRQMQDKVKAMMGANRAANAMSSKVRFKTKKLDANKSHTLESTDMLDASSPSKPDEAAGPDGDASPKKRPTWKGKKVSVVSKSKKSTTKGATGSQDPAPASVIGRVEEDRPLLAAEEITPPKATEGGAVTKAKFSRKSAVSSPDKSLAASPGSVDESEDTSPSPTRESKTKPKFKKRITEKGKSKASSSTLNATEIGAPTEAADETLNPVSEEPPAAQPSSPSKRWSRRASKS